MQFLWRRLEERLDPSREILAEFLKARVTDLVFVTNATTGINSVTRSLAFQPGDELLTTNHDYNACHNVVIEVARRAGAKLVAAQIPFPLKSADQIVDAVLGAVTSRTRLAMIDHVTSDSALVFPIARIIRELEARGVDTLVDGAHAPGMVPIDLQKLRPAYYTGNLHKWICAPKGAAFLWVREDRQEGIQPAVISHGNNRARPGYSAFQDRFDWAGTIDPSSWMCVGEAIRWMGQLLPGGWKELRQRNHALAVSARRHLCERFQVKPPCPEGLLGAMATVPLPERFQGIPPAGKLDAEQLRLYDEYAIEVPLGRRGHPPRRYLRVSAQLHNAIGDYEYLAEAISRL